MLYSWLNAFTKGLEGVLMFLSTAPGWSRLADLKMVESSPCRAGRTKDYTEKKGTELKIVTCPCHETQGMKYVWTCRAFILRVG